MASPIFKWTIFSENLKEELANRIRLAIVFGNDASEAIFITDNDEAFGLGSNKTGCLGLAEDQATKYTQLKKIDALSGIRIKSLAYSFDRNEEKDNGIHVLALTESGRVFGWGRNDYAQLGRATNTSPGLPAEVSGLTGLHIVQVACGDAHSLALTSNNLVFAWGYNFHGQIGLGTNTDQPTPVKVTVGIKSQKVVAIACGQLMSMAVMDNGELYTWGNNKEGLLGLGNTENQSVPTRVESLAGVNIRQVVCGKLHVLARADDGSVYAWGFNSYGQLGTRKKDFHNKPVKVGPADVRFVEVAANVYNHLSVAVRDNGEFWMWGQCRTVTRYECVVSPVRVPVSVASSVHDVFAVYGLPAVTWKPIIVCHNQKANINLVFEDPNTSDLKFIVEGQVIHVHKTVLAIKSQHIKMMLDGEWNKKDEIEITTYSYRVYHAFLKYLYTDQVELRPDQAVDLFDLAKSYFHDDLKNKCDQIIRRDISADNAATVYGTAIRIEAEELEEICFNFILDHFADVFLTKAFQTLDYDTKINVMIKARDDGLVQNRGDENRRVTVGQKRKLNND